MISEARRAGLPLALVTNGSSDTQRKKLSTLGIDAWFDVVVVSGEIGVMKPDPVVFDLVLERFAVDPD
ncbi:MAG: HAD-IA family hydrolase [Acidimicrobiia bacterium]